MPKSKRSRLYTLTKAKKKGLDGKSALVSAVRDCCDRFAELFVFSMDNVRSNKLKDLRLQWRHSRVFFGNRRVLQVALGRTPSEEYKDGLHQVAEHLQGNAGLLFTNESRKQVLQWFAGFAEKDFARAGYIATEEVTLAKGPLIQFPHSFVPQLVSLGVPAALEKGVAVLTEDYDVCRSGEKLSPEQAKLLKLFDIKMADFKVDLICHWNESRNFCTL